MTTGEIVPMFQGALLPLSPGERSLSPDSFTTDGRPVRV